MVKFKLLNKPYFLAFLICLFVFYSGLFNLPEKAPLVSLIDKSEITKITGKIISSPYRISNKKYYSCKVEVSGVENKKNIKSSASGNIIVYIPSEMVEAFYPGKIYSDSRNQVTNIFEAGDNFIFYGNMINNIFYTKNTKALGYDNTIFGQIDKSRAFLRFKFKKLMYNWSDAGGLLIALLSGSREFTEDNIKDYFKKAGLSHILALSGMHLSLFSGISIFIGKKSKRKKFAFILRVIFLILFVWFAGFSPSLLRAFICTMLMILSSMTNKKNPDMILILCFSFLLQCIISPADIKTTGFILSYSALFGILLFNNFIRPFFNRIFSNYLSASFASSASAQIFTAPISLKLFGCIYPIGIISTSIISPLITLFIYSGIILIILSLIFPVIGEASGIFMNFEYNIIKNITFIFSKAPFWSIN